MAVCLREHTEILAILKAKDTNIDIKVFSQQIKFISNVVCHAHRPCK